MSQFVSQMQRDFEARMAERPLVVSCGICNAWSVFAPFNQAKQAAAEHRTLAHPDLKPQRRRRGQLEPVACIIDGCQSNGSATHGATQGLCRRHADKLRART